MKNVGKKFAVILAAALPFQAWSLNLLKANEDFKNKQYEQAFAQYQQGAEVGSAHAYYQLGVMYSKGLGVKADPLTSLMYMSLAAESNYHQADEILSTMISKLSDTQRNNIEQVLVEFKRNKQRINQQYTPEIIEDNLSFKVTFDGEPTLERKFFVDLPEMDTGIGFDGSLGGDGESAISDLSGGLIVSPPALLIVESDVAKDGSARNVSKVQKKGLTNRYIEEYTLFPLSKPMFKGEPVEFVTRSYMGLAADDAFAVVHNMPRLYGDIRKIVNTAEKSIALHDQYQYAMAMINFPWLEKESGHAEKLLKSLAQQGHPGAMYEYGLKLYMEQRQIPEAVKWITEASKFGLARAEYRLGKLLLSSPWVETDEKKALFWFESAMQKGHNASVLHAAKIKLTAQDKALLDVNGAIEYLDNAKQSLQLNPEYFHLLALSHKQRPNRDFSQVIDNLEQAIFMANQTNWDVSEWEGLLASLMQGDITVTDL